MFNFLLEDSKVSSTRVTLFLCTLSACLLVIGLFIYMVIHAVKCTTLDWSGMSLFLTGVSALMGTVLIGKVQQKKVETNANESNKLDNKRTDVSNDIRYTDSK